MKRKRPAIISGQSNHSWVPASGKPNRDYRNGVNSLQSDLIEELRKKCVKGWRCIPKITQLSDSVYKLWILHLWQDTIRSVSGFPFTVANLEKYFWVKYPWSRNPPSYCPSPEYGFQRKLESDALPSTRYKILSSTRPDSLCFTRSLHVPLQWYCQAESSLNGHWVVGPVKKIQTYCLDLQDTDWKKIVLLSLLILDWQERLALLGKIFQHPGRGDWPSKAWRHWIL